MVDKIKTQRSICEERNTMMASEAEDAAYRARKEAGVQVRERRLRAAMSQSELGAKIGEADTFILALESGRVVLSKSLCPA